MNGKHTHRNGWEPEQALVARLDVMCPVLRVAERWAIDNSRAPFSGIQREIPPM